MSAQGLNLLVFRDGRRIVSGEFLKRALAQRLQSPPASPDSGAVLTALLQAGELECALADTGVHTTQCETITDSLASALLENSAVPNLQNFLHMLEHLPVPRQVTVSPPEGFAFYGLHPLAFADAIQQFSSLPSRVTVVGIRSIGTTLSAVAMAALRKCGIRAARITARPAGHPYNRQTDFSPEVLQFLKAEIAGSGMFLIVDEGPGLSGSSFLSVAEALERVGVSREKITLMCTHAPDVDRLCAENAATRWGRFRSIVVPSQPRRPIDAQVWIGGGEWRRYVLHRDQEWPGSWLSFERQKYLSGQTEEARFYKFAGFGRYGEEVFKREEEVAAAGFGLKPKIESNGYISYPFIDGRPMSADDVSESVLARLASYCAFRQNAFAAKADVAPLYQMARNNLNELKIDLEANLQLDRSVIPDGRMQPHEWLLTREGQMLKTDSGSHGDDHFFPGATDIAWDLAGAMVEWQMNDSQTEAFLEMYRRASGDDARARIADYLTAYVVFRAAYCRMAANAMQGTEEAMRLERAAERYISRMQLKLPAGTAICYE